jgi:hypothetical protein
LGVGGSALTVKESRGMSILNNFGFIVGLLIVFIMIVGGLFVRACEKKTWNNGKHYCGGKWEQFDTDSQGGRGYNCSSCDSRTWISYRVDK